MLPTLTLATPSVRWSLAATQGFQHLTTVVLDQALPKGISLVTGMRILKLRNFRGKWSLPDQLRWPCPHLEELCLHDCERLPSSIIQLQGLRRLQSLYEPLASFSQEMWGSSVPDRLVTSRHNSPFQLALGFPPWLLHAPPAPFSRWLQSVLWLWLLCGALLLLPLLLRHG